MNLPVVPPVPPMLARLARKLPVDGFLYEPKWDGFRCLAFRAGEDVDLRSRNDRPLARYFPELVSAFRALPTGRFVLDGEIVVVGSEGGSDFDALLARLHPAASRVERLSAETPASFVAFDLLAMGDADLRATPFAERRARLAETLRPAEPPIFLTPLTDDAEVAERWLRRFRGRGIDGVVAKQADLGYEPARRAMVKVKREETADVVVAGFRWLVDRPLPSSLLLGLYDRDGELHHVGIAAGFAETRRRQLLADVAPLVAPLEGHPWERGFLVTGSRMGRLKGAAGRWTPDEMPQDWVPVTPSLVCEVAYDQVDVDRFRHPARFRRWRPDRDPRSCTLDQLAAPAGGLAELLQPA
ncbi:MAG TPA: ATP-dependent DNA ligase [Gaiellaceae bacterium]|nr:ATP-dependent DNA ligase [Gaiellaceae bacterium]